MTTVADLLNGIRYDLRNYGDVDFDIDTMVHYLNRSINILDARLIAFNSDQTLQQTTATLSEDDDYATVPTRCLTVREVWIDQKRKQQVSMDELYYKRQFRDSDTAEFNFWTHVQEQIQVEVPADDDYTLKVIYDQGSADVTAASNMPFAGTYDDVIREVVVQMGLHKRHKTDSPTDAIYAQIFDQILTMDMVNRRFTRKQYKLDF
jgi:hypothetical protein